MKAYIIVKDEYIQGDLENYVQTTILDVCLNKELAIILQKKYFLKFLLSQRGFSKQDIEKYKQKAENFVGNTLVYKDYWEIELKEYNIVEKDENRNERKDSN